MWKIGKWPSWSQAERQGPWASLVFFFFLKVGECAQLDSLRLSGSMSKHEN